MAKIKKKYVATGAPLYMSQFTMIMLILIVMCMIMSTLSKKQDSGFQEGEDGFGRQRESNSLGIVIGSGQFKFGNYGKARSFSPNPGAKLTDEKQNPHMDALKGEGGTGNSDLEAKKNAKIKYLFAKLMADFPDKSSEMTTAMTDNLNKIALALSLFEFEVVIKVYAKDNKKEDEDFKLAWARAVKIMQFFHKSTKVPITNMNFVVSTNRELINSDREATLDKTSDKKIQQEVLFYFKLL